MTNFDIPNESELNPYKVYDYDLVDSTYPIEDNQSHGVYDQFLWLRDTLVKTGKKYSGKAGSKLVIGETEDTVEVIWNNKFKLAFEPGWKRDWSRINVDSLGPYVTWSAVVAGDWGTPLCCRIEQTGRYRLVHKAQVVDLQSSVTKVHAYIQLYAIDGNGGYPSTPNSVAVFDWECVKAVEGTTYGTDPNGTCRIQLTLGSIFNSITTFGYNERTLNRGDVLVMKVVDQFGNDLTVKPSSNFMSVELTDLIVKKR